MRDVKFFILSVVGTLFLFYSCTKYEYKNLTQDQLKDTISLTLNYQSVEQRIENTKTILNVNPTKVSDANIYIFNEQGDIITHSFSTSLTTIKDLVIFTNLKYRVYAIANAGKSLPYKTIADIEQYKHTISNIGELVDASGAFLMGGKTDLITLTNNMMLDIPLTRSVSKFVLICNYDNLDAGVTIDIKRVQLKNAPAQVTLFSDSRASNQEVLDGEERLTSDIPDIKAGVPFYLYENLQGVVAPAALDNKSKEQLMNERDKLNSSYIEMVYDYNSSSQTGTIIYRFYLGETHKDCNVKRNTQYNCTVMFKGDGSVGESTWSVDSEGIFDLVTSLTLNPTSYTFTALNEQMNIVATILPLTANNKTLVWSSTDENIAKVDATGKVTSVNDGSCIITATTTDGTNISATCNIEVNSKIYVTGVSVDPTTLDLYVSEQAQLTASVTPTDATNPALVWSSTDENVAKVDANGKVTAIAQGECKIKVASVDDPTKFAECVVKVSAKTFTLTPSSATLYTTEKLQLQWGGVPPGTPSFSSSNSAIASVDANGLITGLSNGTAKISATLNGITRTCDVIVVEPKVEFPYSSKIMFDGEIIEIPFSTLVPNTSIPNVVSSDNAIIEILEVTSNSVKVKAKQIGTASVTATMATSQAICNINVQELKIVFNDVAPLVFYQGFNDDVNYTIYPEHARGLEVVWTSSNTASLININKNTYQGVGANTTANIVATFVDYPTKIFSTSAQVNPAITIAESSINLGANSGSSSSKFNDIHVSYQLTIDKHPRANIAFSGNKVGTSGTNILQCSASGLLSTATTTTMNGITNVVATITNADNSTQYTSRVEVYVYEVVKVYALYNEYESGPAHEQGEKWYYGIASSNSDKQVGNDFRASLKYGTNEDDIFSTDASKVGTYSQEVARFIDTDSYPLANNAEWYYDTIDILFDRSGTIIKYYYSANKFGN